MSMTKPAIALIAAIARNGVIGRDNRLLWRLRSDLRRFRQLTLGKPMIMGRKTYDSIGKPLPGRINIVLTRDPNVDIEGVLLASSLADALETARGVAEERHVSEIMVAGGGEIYRQTLPLASRLYLTEVDLAPEGDAFFPVPDLSTFKEVQRVAYRKSLDDEADFAFVDYVRR